MNANTLTPMIRRAITLAHSAPQHTLTRCCGGFHDAAAPRGTTIVTRRTANTLHNAMLADFDHRDWPRSMTLTAEGLRIAQDLSADTGSKAAQA